MTSFENFGERETASAADCMECRICWYIYDPAQGDPVSQIPPGTAFANLPQDWRCPTCDAVQASFMRTGG